MRKYPLAKDEYYHVYNRGVDKRLIFKRKEDFNRFIESIELFNTEKPIGSIRDTKEAHKKPNDKFPRRPTSGKKLVEIVAYCINPNHYHFLLKQVSKDGISEFMKRLGGGYTKYFNEKYNRSGALFQGRFKSSHINSDDYLKLLSVYVNLNYKVHKISGKNLDFVKSSWEEYMGNKSEGNLADGKESILKMFDDNKDYKKFSIRMLKEIIERREETEMREKLLEL